MKKTRHYRGEFPFARLLMPFLCGISMGVYIKAIGLWPLATCTIFILFALLTAHFAYKKWQLWRFTGWLGFGVSVFLFFCGWWATESRKDIYKPAYFAKHSASQLIIIINQEPRPAGHILRFTADVKQGISGKKAFPVCGQLMVSVKTDTIHKTVYRYGDELLIPSKFAGTEPPYNPAEFNFKRYLQNQNIWHQTFLYADGVQILARKKGNPVIAYAKSLREKMVVKLNRYVHDKEAAAVASTLLLGYRASLSSETLGAYSRTGTLHVLSVSGMHVALLYIVIGKLLGMPLSGRKNRWLKPVVSIFLIWVYALLTGFSPSVNRAALMISLLITGKAFNRNAHSLNILAFSAFVLLLYNPFYLTDVGFQLSYLAVFGLIVLQPAIQKCWQPQNRYVTMLWSACCVSLAAQMVTSPLSLYYFHQFPVYFLISNLFILIPSAAIMYSGILFLICPDGLICKGLGWILEQSIRITNGGLHLIEKWPYASIDRVWIDFPEYIFLSLIMLALAATLWLNNKKPLPVLLISALLFCASLSCTSIKKQGQNQLVFFSLRKNMAIGFSAENKAAILSNLNSNEKTFRYSVQPWVDSMGLRKYRLIHPQKNICTDCYVKNGNLIQVKNIVLLMYDKNMAQKQLAVPLDVDVVYVSGNSRISLDDIRKTASFRMLIIGGQNSKWLNEKLCSESAAAGIPFYSLKNKPAFILSLP